MPELVNPPRFGKAKREGRGEEPSCTRGFVPEEDKGLQNLPPCPRRGRFPVTRSGLNEAPEVGSRLLLARGVLLLWCCAGLGIFPGTELFHPGSGAGGDCG